MGRPSGLSRETLSSPLEVQERGMDYLVEELVSGSLKSMSTNMVSDSPSALDKGLTRLVSFAAYCVMIQC